MTKPKWITDRDLGILANGSYFEKPMIANSVNTPINYRLISGDLPNGVILEQSGLLSGVPNIMNSAVGELNRVYTFTVRAEDSNERIADKTFVVEVSGVQPPTIISTTTNLGMYFDGTYFQYQLEALDDHPGSKLTWRIVNGSLPPGITMTRDGFISGFFYQNKISEEAFSRIGWDRLAWDRFMYDFTQQQHDRDYGFTVELSDGFNFSRQNYIIRVIAKDLLTADRTIRTVDDDDLFISYTPAHLPFITTMPQRLPEIKPELARQNTYFAFKFDAVDFDGDPIYFEITSLDELGFDQYGEPDPLLVTIGDNENVIINGPESHGTPFDMDAFDSSDYPLPLYLGLNNQTGWYTGQLGRQTEARKEYPFYVFARKSYDFNLKGYKSLFIVTVLGQVDDNIVWVTQPDMGSIDNGSIAALRVEAVNTLGAPLTYSLKNDGSKMPQGLRLHTDGMISGRVSFDYIGLDNGLTTIDATKNTSFDQIYTFTVIAQTARKSSFSERTFTIKVNRTNKKPFENLYLKGFPNRDQRTLFENIMAREDLFPNQLIYRPEDPYYGKAKELRFLFLAGIEPTNVATYVEAISKNHYTKNILFGNVKTAVALDEFYNIQYEVVYLEVIDDKEGKDPVTGLPAPPAQVIDLSKNKSTYREDNGFELLELTPNALGNMSKRIEDIVGIATENALPQWMICPQIDYDRPGKYTLPLGYTRAVVLAYTVPGAAKLIAYRLKNANFSFNSIPFKTDRYMLDNYLTRNYDVDLEKFIPGEETTIDKLPSIAERYRDLGAVDYAVRDSYSSINNKLVSEIISAGGIDGEVSFEDGEILVFVPPETFGPEKPGYFEKIMFGVLDEKSAVYQININISGLVTLTKFRNTKPGDIITVQKGQTYAGVRMNFEAYPLHGASPRWWPFDKTLVDDPNSTDKLVKLHKETTFDQRGTRFFSYRDQYADIETTAKYIKFPKNGVFI